MPLKSEVRKNLKLQRKKIVNKADKDRKISENILKSSFYKNAKLILFYAALDDEVNIDICISAALKNGKKTALPYCVDQDGYMEYYYITSFEDVKAGSFGIREPDIQKCAKVLDFDGSVCIVPGIAFDKKGYRLGYGKGYYDRFLENYVSLSVGLCYNELIADTLPTGEYDIPVSCLVSEKGIFMLDKEEKDG